MIDDICKAINRVGYTIKSPDYAYELRMKAHKALAAICEENEKLRAEVNDLRATLRNCLTDANFMRAAAAALKETEQ